MMNMKAMILEKTAPVNKNLLILKNIPLPEPKKGEILVKVTVYGICHTELDEIEGRLIPPKLPIIPGHEIVGRVEKLRPDAKRYKLGDRVGIAWIHWACNTCGFCKKGNENLYRKAS